MTRGVILLSEFEGLHDLLSGIYGKIEFRRGIGNTFVFHNEDMELYFRVMPGLWLAIARIDVGVGRTRQGIGTKILQWLVDYARQNGIPMIKMESVLTDMCAAFCHKHGFIGQAESLDWILAVR